MTPIGFCSVAELLPSIVVVEVIAVRKALCFSENKLKYNAFTHPNAFLKTKYSMYNRGILALFSLHCYQIMLI